MFIWTNVTLFHFSSYYFQLVWLYIQANLINARLLKEREEEMVATKREKDALEKQRIQEELKKRKDEAKEFADTLSERFARYLYQSS